MNLQQIKKKLNKVNQFYDYLQSNQDEIARLDKDAFLATIRDLYEACFDVKNQEEVVAVAVQKKAVKVEQKDEGPQFVFVQEDKQKKAPVVEKTVNVKEEKVVVETEAIVEKATVVEVTQVDEAVIEKEVTDNAATFNADFEELFMFKAATDLSQKLSETPLKNLNKALGLNEKFLFINELFAGDVAKFQQSVKVLDEGKDFDFARTHIESELIEQFDWMNKQKKKIAKDFVKLVRRRYL